MAQWGTGGQIDSMDEVGEDGGSFQSPEITNTHAVPSGSFCRELRLPRYLLVALVPYSCFYLQPESVCPGRAQSHTRPYLHGHWEQ